MSEWAACALGELISLEYGSALGAEDRTGEGYPVFGSNGVVGHHATPLVSGPGIVVGRKGSAGALAWSDSDFWPIDTTYWVKPKTALDLRWLYDALRRCGLDHLHSSTGVPGLNRGDAYEKRVPVPPLEEQRRIAEILDTIDETIQATERVIAKLWDSRAGLLRKRLREIDFGYAMVPLLSVVSLPRGQVDPRVEPFRSMTLVAPDHIVGGGRGRLLARESAQAQGAISGKYRFRPGDVVYSKIRPELRKAWLADGGGLCSADMYPLTPSEALDSGYLAQVILGDRFSRFAASVSGRSSGMPKVNREELSEFKIAVPPTPVQAQVGQLAHDGMTRIDAETALLEKLIETRAGLASDLLLGRVRTVAA